MEYIAFIHKEDDSYVAIVPDLGYTSSFGSTFTEAVHNIIEACELYAEDEEVLLINVKVEKNVRINVMLPAGLLRAVNTKAEEVYHGNRSAYIQDLMQRDIYMQM